MLRTRKGFDTMTNQKDIFSYLVPGKCAHLAGIGGVSMSPLAEVLHGMGLKVQGSDMNDGPSVEHLRSLGHPRGHRPCGGQPWRVPTLLSAPPPSTTTIPRSPARSTRGIPVFRARAGLGRYHAGLQKRPLHLRHARQDDDHFAWRRTSSWPRRKTRPS